MSSGVFLVQVWHHITWKMDCMLLSWKKGLYLAHKSMNSNHFTWTIAGIFLYSYQLPYVAKDILRQLMAVVFCVCYILQCQTGYPRWDGRSGQQMSQKVWAWYLVIFSCLSCGLRRIPACVLQKADLKATFHQQSILVAELTLPLVDKIWQHICLAQLLFFIPCIELLFSWWEYDVSQRQNGQTCQKAEPVEYDQFHDNSLLRTVVIE